MKYYYDTVVNNFGKNPIYLKDVLPVFVARVSGAILTSTFIALILKTLSQMFHVVGKTELAKHVVVPAFAKSNWALITFNIGLPVLSILLQLVIPYWNERKKVDGENLKNDKKILDNKIVEETPKDEKTVINKDEKTVINSESLLSECGQSIVDAIEEAIKEGGESFDAPSFIVGNTIEIHRILTALQLRYPFPGWDFSYDDSRPRLESFTWKNKCHMTINGYQVEMWPLNRVEQGLVNKIYNDFQKNSTTAVGDEITNRGIKKILDYFEKHCKELPVSFNTRERVFMRGKNEKNCNPIGRKILYQNLTVDEKTMYLEVAKGLNDSKTPINSKVNNTTSISKILTALQNAYTFREFSYDQRTNGFISKKHSTI